MPVFVVVFFDLKISIFLVKTVALYILNVYNVSIITKGAKVSLPSNQGGPGL